MRAIQYPGKLGNVDAELEKTYLEHYLPTLPAGAPTQPPAMGKVPTTLSRMIDGEAARQEVNSRNFVTTAFKSQVMRWLRLQVDRRDAGRTGIAHPNRVKSAVALITKMAWEGVTRGACFQNNGFG